ncbi:MAG TPA: agmatine deiminase family protein [Burkholderiaceae bacterium]|nr:agmatine deiminase family protein [Burkholderiaceae bacterium]
MSHAAGHDALTRGLVDALAPTVRLRCWVADDAAAQAARALDGRMDVQVLPGITFFLRDVAVLTREAGGDAGIVDFRASQYGAATWCERRHGPGPDREGCAAHARSAAERHDGIDRALAQRVGATLHGTPLAMEGGGIETNGRGLLIAVESLWRTRNPGLTRGETERELMRLPGVRKVIWLPEGLAEDVHLRATITGTHVAWGAGGHSDQFVRFADERTVLLAWPDGDHPVSRLSRARMQRNAAILETAADLQGRLLRVVRLPMPRLVQRRVVLEDETDPLRPEAWRTDWFPAAERRRAGQALWQVATASYLNFVIANDVVVLPEFRPHGTPEALQSGVRRLFEAVFPGRRVVFVDAMTAHWVGGGLHCTSLNVP